MGVDTGSGVESERKLKYLGKGILCNESDRIVVDTNLNRLAHLVVDVVVHHPGTSVQKNWNCA